MKNEINEIKNLLASTKTLIGRGSYDQSQKNILLMIEKLLLLINNNSNNVSLSYETKSLTDLIKESLSDYVKKDELKTINTQVSKKRNIRSKRESLKNKNVSIETNIQPNVIKIEE